MNTYSSFFQPSLFAIKLLFLSACNGCSENTNPEWEAVETISPASNWDVTDVAISFRWYRQLQTNEEGELLAAKNPIFRSDKFVV